MYSFRQIRQERGKIPRRLSKMECCQLLFLYDRVGQYSAPVAFQEEIGLLYGLHDGLFEVELMRVLELTVYVSKLVFLDEVMMLNLLILMIAGV